MFSEILCLLLIVWIGFYINYSWLISFFFWSDTGHRLLICSNCFLTKTRNSRSDFIQIVLADSSSSSFAMQSFDYHSPRAMVDCFVVTSCSTTSCCRHNDHYHHHHRRRHRPYDAGWSLSSQFPFDQYVIDSHVHVFRLLVTNKKKRKLKLFLPGFSLNFIRMSTKSSMGGGGFVFHIPASALIYCPRHYFGLIAVGV